MKTGLIMEGGAIGVSAGAAFGCNYKSRQIGRVIRPAEALPIGRTEKDQKNCGWCMRSAGKPPKQESGKFSNS